VAVAALVLGGGALAATQVLEVGAPVPDEPALRATPHTGAGVARKDARILPLRVVDTAGGRFGRVLPGAGGRLQLRPISTSPGQNSLCGFVARNGYPVLRGLRTVQVTGGDGDPRRCGGAACPITAVRTIRYGLLGPAARSATYVDGAGRKGPTMRVDGAHGGAYLFVVRTDPAPYAAAERWQHEVRQRMEAEQRRLRAAGRTPEQALRGAMARASGQRPPAAARQSSRVRDGVDATFAGGTTLRVAGHGRTAGPLPGVARPHAPRAPVDVRAPLRVTRTGAAASATYTVRFRAPVAITRADHGYSFTVAGRGGRDCSRRSGLGGGWATTRDLAAGETVSFVARPSFGGARSAWCPGAYRLRVGYRSGSGPFRGRLVGTSAFRVPGCRPRTTAPRELRLLAPRALAGRVLERGGGGARLGGAPPGGPRRRRRSARSAPPDAPGRPRAPARRRAARPRRRRRRRRRRSGGRPRAARRSRAGPGPRSRPSSGARRSSAAGSAR
jgi:hypothetical protein